ncbi:36334_t:CDS:2, partial [Racocetra persica]
YAFLSHMENRLEQKLEKRLGNSLSKVLNNSLQQWSVQLNKASWVGAAESNFPKKIFKKPRNQYEYDVEDSKEKVTEVQELLKLRAFVLRVAEEEGWKVVAKIPKPTSSETDEFRELLTEARKQAKPSEGFPAFYSRGTWRSRGTLCPAPTTYVSRVPESECDPEP